MQKAKLENRYTHSDIYNMWAARTLEPRVLERAEMLTGPSTKVEIPVPAAREGRLDKGNKDRLHRWGQASSHHNLKYGGAHISNLTASGCRRPETQALNQLYRKALGKNKGGGSARASQGGEWWR